MKLSSKLIKKVENFAETYDGLKKATAEVAEQIEDMKKLTEEGAELKIANFSQKTSVVARKFSAALDGMKNSIDDAVVAIDDVSKLATEEAEKVPEIQSFARKARIAHREFSAMEGKYIAAGEAVATVLEAKDAGTNIKDSVVPASPERDPNADITATTTKVSTTSPTEGIAPVEEGKINAAETTNFSATEFVKFSLSGAIKAFAEFADQLNEVGDLVTEVVEVSKPEPVAEVTPASPAIEAPKFDAESVKKELIDAGIEAYKAGDESKREEIATKASELEAEVPGAGEEVVTAIENFAAQNPKTKTETTEEACPICGMTPCECARPAETKNFSSSKVCPECGKEVCECEITAETPDTDYTKDQELLVEQGIKAFAAKDEDKMKKVSEFCEELEGLKPGAGKAVVETIENFASLFKLGFGTKSATFCGDNKTFAAIKDTINFAADQLVAGDKWDTDIIAAKCDDLEQMQPGAGDIVASTLESFAKVVKNIKDKMTPETESKVLAEFSEALERFVDEIPVVDKTFAHKLKKSCFAALESCDAGDKEACIKFCDQVSKGLAEPTVTDQKLKDFGKSLEKFCGRLTKFAETAASEAPAEIVKGDTELNEVLDKMGEKGAQLDAKISTFATKLCESYKSMKCFTEKQLEQKVGLVEGLKECFSTVGVNFGEEQASTESEVKVESNEEKQEPIVSVPDDKNEVTESEITTEENAAPAVEPQKPELAPGEYSPDLVNAAGDESYDPTAIAGTKLVEEEEIPEENKPSDTSVTLPTNFSKTNESFESKFESIFDL